MKNEYDAITPYLPTEGFLGTYLAFSSNLEACPRFRFFSAACVMGAAINNRVWLQRGDPGLLPRLMPNPWVILLGPPFRGHKTSCIHMAVNAYIQAFEEARILADKLTPEVVVKALSEPKTDSEKIRIGPRDAVGLISAPEMSVIFGKQQYNTGMVSLITDLYDYREEWKSETIGRGKEVLRNNCISIIAGSTPKWMRSMIPQDAFTGGFMRRFIIVELPNTWYRRKALPKRPGSDTWDTVVSTFKDLQDVKGEFGWTKEGESYYVDYYESYKPTGDESYDAYKEAECEQALKLAMLLDINSGEFSLTKHSLEQAISIMQSISVETKQRIVSLTTNPRMSVVQEILNVIRFEHVIKEGDLLNRVYRSLNQGERQFYEALSILRKTGAIEPIGKAPNFSYKLKKEPKEDSLC